MTLYPNWLEVHGKVEGQVLLVLLPVENKDPNQQFINCTLFKTFGFLRGNLTAAIGIYCWDKATKRALFLEVNIVV